MKTLITGCSGLVGSAVVEELFAKGYSLHCLKRSSDSRAEQFWDTAKLPVAGENMCDSVVHLAGENVASGRWSSQKKKRILDSRVEGTRALVDYIATLEQKPKVFLCASAVGIYGNRGEERMDEKSSPGEGFLADVCCQWEQQTARLSRMGVRTVNLRFGMILSPQGGALHKMIPPFKLGLGGVIGTGRQIVPWISIRDVVEIIDFIVTQENLSGPVNVVSPNHTTNRELTKLLGKSLGVPTLLKMPAFAARAVFGQMADEMLLSSCRAVPSRLTEAGYQFRDPVLEPLLDYCVNGV
ncbi:TIGR01777 family oxidoreductase [Desulforhopalus singaporensis]|uniref:TIGR01777 family protein n=1 Tax=Desulforhopalus singaporensis TaxID=91360 RepID=A0A1H0PC89_9BACT|nr:TIGR01777 family oxidoreductase [Desulforhopalus singaporensis]SDP02614.1 hypothetical protein SAMN05660330_01608 [Desulforhopalus singaporensis]